VGTTVPGARHQTIFRDLFAYCAHPHLVALDDGGWLCVFNRSVRRPLILHPPHDPQYHNVVVRSTDEGESWAVPAVVPGYDWHGVECAGLTPLGDGHVLLNQWRFRWYPVDVARKQPLADLQLPEDLLAELRRSRDLDAAVSAVPADALLPWARGPGGTFVHRSFAGGRTFEEAVEVDTAPYSGGYGMRGAIELPDGELLLPLSDVPHYQRIFAVRSRDGGKSWSRAVELDVLRWRHRLLKFLDRHGRLYVSGKNWSQRHWGWIRAQSFALAPLQRTFEATLFALEQALAHQAELEKEIEALAQRPPYAEPVGWLRCFRGIDTLSAMILVAEIVDFQRFRRPRELMAYVGLVPSEYSSGAAEHRGAITKTGNAHARRALVEAAWHYRHRPTVGRALAHRSHGQPPNCLAHAWRAQQRLHRRYRHLIGHGKRPPVAVTAIARELVAFIWAAMTRHPVVAA
jgi:Transposase IS116/IS110/IS902 family